MERTKFDNKAFSSVRETKKVSRKAVNDAGNGIITIEVIKSYDGIPVGHRQKVRERSSATSYMINNGYWKIV